MSQDRFAAITRKTHEVLALAQRLYGVAIQPSISYDLRGRVAGWAGCRHCAGGPRYTLRFNQDLIRGNHFEDMRDETVAHEVAHLICYARPELGRNHDNGWRRVCIALGGNGNTRHSYDVSHAAGSIVYVTDRGHEVKLSKIRHAKIQAGVVYTFKKNKGRVDQYCAWAPEGQQPRVRRERPAALVLPVTPTMPQWVSNRMPPQAPPAIQPRPGLSKAEQVRAYIREARTNGGGQDWVVTRAQINLGMPRAQAIRYVTENWNRA